MTDPDLHRRPADATTVQLVQQLTEQSKQLIRSELRLAQAEMTQKTKRAGIGVGLFGGAGLVALYGVGTLIATVILALALLMPPWVAALIVSILLLTVAAAAAVMGKKQVGEATPPQPEQTITNVKEDVGTLKKGSSR